MEFQIVIEALLGQLDEVAHVDGGIETGQLHLDVTLGGMDNGDFSAGGLVCRGIQCHE